MNNLVRGIERSKFVLRASKISFPTSESTAVGARGLTAQQELCLRQHSALSSQLQLSTSFAPASLTLTRNFSSMSPDTSDRVRPPSALEQANLETITPGHAIRVLQIYASQGSLIRRSDFVELCNSSRPGKKRDAKVIATALREFKRNNRFVLHKDGARAAVEGMMRSMTPTYKVVFGKARLDAAAFVAKQILDEKTGLYFAVEVDLVDDVLKELHKSLVEMEERGMKVKIDNVGGEGDEEEQSAEDEMLATAMQVTHDLTKLLIKRRSLPENDMKKRARRAYKNLMQVNDGPETSTMTVATQISLMVGGSSQAREHIIAPFNDAWWSKRWSSGIDPSIIQMIEEAEGKEAEERALAESAENADAGDDAGEDSNAEEGDADENDPEQESTSPDETKN